MGQPSSKPSSNQVSPDLSSTESLSTLKGFVAAESSVDRNSEVIADSTVVNDRKVERVKTWMKFPDRQPKSSFELDVHLNQSIHRGKTLVNFTDDHDSKPLSGIDAILEGMYI